MFVSPIVLYVNLVHGRYTTNTPFSVEVMGSAIKTGKGGSVRVLVRSHNCWHSYKNREAAQKTRAVPIMITLGHLTFLVQFFVVYIFTYFLPTDCLWTLFWVSNPPATAFQTAVILKLIWFNFTFDMFLIMQGLFCLRQWSNTFANFSLSKLFDYVFLEVSGYKFRLCPCSSGYVSMCTSSEWRAEPWPFLL